VGFLGVIYAQVLPGRTSTNGELLLGTAVFVVANAAVSLWSARGTRGIESFTLAFGVRVLMNIGLVVLAAWLLGRGDGELNQDNALFFVLLLSLITLFDDRYRPVYNARFSAVNDGISTER